MGVETRADFCPTGENDSVWRCLWLSRCENCSCHLVGRSQGAAPHLIMHTVRTHTHTHTPRIIQLKMLTVLRSGNPGLDQRDDLMGLESEWTDSGSVQEVKSTRFNERRNVGLRGRCYWGSVSSFSKIPGKLCPEPSFPRKSKTFFFLLWNAFVLRIRWKVGVGNWGWEPNSNIFKSSFTKSAVAWIGLPSRLVPRCLSGPCYWSYNC